MAKICRFIEGVSISVTSGGFRVLGLNRGNPVTDQYRLDEAPITDVAQVDDGVVHAMLASGAIYSIEQDDAVGFVVRKIAA